MRPLIGRPANAIIFSTMRICSSATLSRAVTLGISAADAVAAIDTDNAAVRISVMNVLVFLHSENLDKNYFYRNFHEGCLFLYYLLNIFRTVYLSFLSMVFYFILCKSF